MNVLWDFLRCIVRPCVSREQAVEVACAEYERQGFDWRTTKTRIESGLLCYRVFFGDGTDVPWMKISKRDGRILHFGVPQRSRRS